MKLNAENKWVSEYWHPAVAVDAVVFGFDPERKQLAVLLVERGKDPYKGAWALPGGFITQNDPSTKDAMLRELKEETNVEGVEPIEFHTFSDAGRDPRERVISIAFYALVNVNDYLKIKGGSDAQNAQWFLIDELPELAFDHKKIIDMALARLQRSIYFEPVGFRLLDKEFTMPQLQSIYLAILRPAEGEEGGLGDRRNFAKKMLSLGYIVPTGKVVVDSRNRPPLLYTFDEEAYKNAKRKGMKLEF